MYASSDSSNEVVNHATVQGEIRRGSAPVNYEAVDHDAAFLQTTGSQRRQTRPTVDTYVYTSESDNRGDSDSDFDNSVDFDRRQDFYKPASHLKKAVNVKH